MSTGVVEAGDSLIEFGASLHSAVVVSAIDSFLC